MDKDDRRTLCLMPTVEPLWVVSSRGGGTERIIMILLRHGQSNESHRLGVLAHHREGANVKENLWDHHLGCP